jgi:CheY-like chemotaxis protein
MSNGFIILIADRNRNVLELLRREFESEGYQVRLARDGRRVLRIINSDESPDLLILDLEMPYVGGLEILERLKDRESPLPVVIHTFFSEALNNPAVNKASALVEKTGNNIDDLRRVVGEVLQKFYPRQFAHMKEISKKTAKTIVLQT